MLLKKRISLFYFLNLIKWDALAILCYATLMGLFDHLPILKSIDIPLGHAALVGTLVSLLLAFRTAQSYERWWEARIIWGAIVNDSRTLIRQLLEFIPNDGQKAGIIRSFAIRQSAWCFALTHSLRRTEPSQKLKDYCAEHKLESENLPNLLLTKHAEELAQVSAGYQLNANMQIQIDTTLQRLTDSMGRCERIKNTVFPWSYSLLIHFLIYVFMTILPFGLERNNKVLEVFIVTVVPLLFIAIERTAILMQDPFENRPTDTPMTTLSETIERNLAEMSGLGAISKPPAPETYYVM